MKGTAFLVFFSIVFSVYGLVNLYLFLRGWQALELMPQYRRVYIILFLFLSLSYIAGRFLEKVWLSFFSEALIWIGSFWLAAMVYFLFAALISDLSRLILQSIPPAKMWFHSYLPEIKLRLFAGVLFLTAVLVIFGRLNALWPAITQLNIHITKTVREQEHLHLVLVSDVHLGTVIGRSRLEKLASQIEKLQPDLVVFAGDLLDEDLEPVIRQDLGSLLCSIRAPLGVYAINGNHEHIGGAEQAFQYLQSHGIILLRDSVVLINNSFYLVGREDRSSRRFNGVVRRPLSALLKNIDSSKPIILLDHQPYKLEEAQTFGVDLQLSGHTHHGQLWPFQWITQRVYQISRGYKKIGNTHYYVSTGYGTWGPPVRIGNRPEIVSIHIRFSPL